MARLTTDFRLRTSFRRLNLDRCHGQVTYNLVQNPRRQRQLTALFHLSRHLDLHREFQIGRRQFDTVFLGLH